MKIYDFNWERARRIPIAERKRLLNTPEARRKRQLLREKQFAELAKRGVTITRNADTE